MQQTAALWSCWSMEGWESFTQDEEKEERTAGY